MKIVESSMKLVVGDKIQIGVTRFNGRGSGYETTIEEAIVTKINRLGMRAEGNGCSYVVGPLGARLTISKNLGKVPSNDK